MISLKSLLTEEVKKISLQQAFDNKMFGPVFHGTTSDKREKIGQEGFKIFYGMERSGDVSHGFEFSDYSKGIPAPIHFLGFGIYFTTKLLIAKMYSYGATKRELSTYYLYVPKLETINWGSPNTMMKWWIENGYDFKSPYNSEDKNTMFSREDLRTVNEERYRATVHMTNELKSKYDAIWYKGIGIRQLLDGDQICVFDPSNIYEIDKSLIKPGEVGSRVVSKVGIGPHSNGKNYVPFGTKGIILGKKDGEEMKRQYPMSATWIQDAKYLYDVQWDKGGRMSSVLDKWIEPYQKKSKM